MYNHPDELKRAKKIISESLDKCESLLFFGIKHGEEVVGITAGSDREHANLLVSAARLDEGFASLLVKIGEKIKELGIHETCKN